MNAIIRMMNTQMKGCGKILIEGINKNTFREHTLVALKTYDYLKI